MDFSWFWLRLDRVMLWMDKKIQNAKPRDDRRIDISLDRPIFVLYLSRREDPVEFTQKLRDLSHCAEFFILNSNCDETYIELLNPRIVVDEIGLASEVTQKLDLMHLLLSGKSTPESLTKILDKEG